MSQENEEVVLKQFELANARDFDGVMGTWGEDVALALHWDAGPMGVSTQGKAEVAEWFGDWFRQFGPD